MLPNIREQLRSRIGLVLNRFLMSVSFNSEDGCFGDVGALELLKIGQWLKCSNPRDTFFGISGLLGIEHRGICKVSYTASVSQVYTDAMNHIVTSDNSLECICFDREKNLEPMEDTEFLTWVQDRRVKSRHSLGYLYGYLSGPYAASLSTQHIISFKSLGPIMVASGIHIDTITDIFYLSDYNGEV